MAVRIVHPQPSFFMYDKLSVYLNMNFYTILTEFYRYPKHNLDITYDFFCFLQDCHPDIWQKLNEFYADDYSHDGSPRLCLYGWDEITKPGNFSLFLSGIKSIWEFLTNQEYGKCFYCGEETNVAFEHKIIVSYEFGPVVKFYEHFEMDGSIREERLCCRECATAMLNNLVGKMNPEKETCWV